MESYSKPVMTVVEQNIDDGASTIDDDASTILVDFSDLGGQAPASARATPMPHLDESSLRQHELLLQQQQQQHHQQQEQQFQYIQSLLREIENLRAQLDRLSVEVREKKLSD